MRVYARECGVYLVRMFRLPFGDLLLKCQACGWVYRASDADELCPECGN